MALRFPSKAFCPYVTYWLAGMLHINLLSLLLPGGGSCTPIIRQAGCWQAVQPANTTHVYPNQFYPPHLLLLPPLLPLLLCHSFQHCIYGTALLLKSFLPFTLGCLLARTLDLPIAAAMTAQQNIP
jgi:hypothetical protein